MPWRRGDSPGRIPLASGSTTFSIRWLADKEGICFSFFKTPLCTAERGRGESILRVVTERVVHKQFYSKPHVRY